MISYAQNFEDVVLERVFKGQEKGFYIDIGAWDPDVDSVTKHFYLKGWSGINAEPVDQYFEKLQAARPRDINLNVAIGVKGQEFFEVDDTGLSGFIDETGRAAAAEAGYSVRSSPKPVISLAELTSRYAAKREVDFLKIDVEGSERAVIESAEWRGFRPRVIVVEAVEPLSNRPSWFEWEGLLFAAAYEFALFDGLNRFYYRCEEPELREPLSVPANVLDKYVPAKLVELRNQLDQLKAQIRSNRRSAWFRLPR